MIWCKIKHGWLDEWIGITRERIFLNRQKSVSWWPVSSSIQPMLMTLNPLKRRHSMSQKRCISRSHVWSLYRSFFFQVSQHFSSVTTTFVRTSAALSHTIIDQLLRNQNLPLVSTVYFNLRKGRPYYCNLQEYQRNDCRFADQATAREAIPRATWPSAQCIKKRGSTPEWAKIFYHTIVSKNRRIELETGREGTSFYLIRNSFSQAIPIHLSNHPCLILQHITMKLVNNKKNREKCFKKIYCLPYPKTKFPIWMMCETLWTITTKYTIQSYAY